MGKRRNERKSKAKLDFEVEDSERLNPAFVFDDSNDEEANEDLSLKIVEKAMSRVASRANRSKDEITGECAVVTEIPDNITTELVKSKSVQKKSRRVKKKNKKFETEAKFDEKEEQKAEDFQTMKLLEVQEANGTDNSNSDNIVLRRLLRGPRYFDPPDNSWGTCYNCGEEGHSAVNCTSARRKKPCFVCGSFEHGAKQCQKGQDCFICKERSHRAKDCPKKFKLCTKLCLKCGASGHAMPSCNNDYSPDDLKKIQCYVCKSFGHLSCANYFETAAEISCYKCGLFGHAGLECRGSHGETAGSSSSSVCYNCDEVGHFARECTSATKVKKRNRELSTLGKRLSKSDKMSSHVKSAPEYHIEGHKNKKMHLEEEGFRSLNKQKHRGGWLTNDLGDFHRQTTYANRWHSPSTPKYKRHPISNLTSGGQITSPRNWKGSSKSYSNSSYTQGSANVTESRYSASRFGNMHHNGMRRNYSLWEQ